MFCENIKLNFSRDILQYLRETLKIKTSCRLTSLYFILYSKLEKIWLDIFFDCINENYRLRVIPVNKMNFFNYYRPSRPFKFGSEFRSKEMKGRPLFSSFLENLHEKRSAFHFLGSEFRSKNERPAVAIIL